MSKHVQSMPSTDPEAIRARLEQLVQAYVWVARQHQESLLAVLALDLDMRHSADFARLCDARNASMFTARQLRWTFSGTRTLTEKRRAAARYAEHLATVN